MILTIALLLIPPPVEQLQANCAAPAYATDMLVCDDPELKARDAEIGALLCQSGATAIKGLAPFIEPQADWFKRRSLCAMKANGPLCTAEAYRERLAVLRAIQFRTDQVPRNYKCVGKSVPGPVSAATQDDGTSLCRCRSDRSGPARCEYSRLATLRQTARIDCSTDSGNGIDGAQVQES